MLQTAQEWIERLELEPLEFEGGYFRETWRDEHSTAIYYLLTSDTFSAMHRLDSDEIFHFHAGDRVEMLLLDPDGSGRVVSLHNSGDVGSEPQVHVPRGCWQGSVVAAGGRFALMGTTMAPGFRPDGFEPGGPAGLCAAYPDFAGPIEDRTHA